MKNKIYNPGSKEAIEKGCLCPVIDNHYGKGYSGPYGISTEEEPLFIINENCPLHGGKNEK